MRLLVLLTVCVSLAATFASRNRYVRSTSNSDALGALLRSERDKIILWNGLSKPFAAVKTHGRAPAVVIYADVVGLLECVRVRK
jgi:hypothetical protein